MKITAKQYYRAGIMPYFFDERGVKKTASEKIKHSLFKAFNGNTQARETPIPTVNIFYQHQPCFLPFHLADKKHPLTGTWQLQLENSNQIISGKIKARGITLPQDLPLGYHQLQLKTVDKTFNCTIIIAPERCYQPQAVIEQKDCGEPSYNYTP